MHTHNRGIRMVWMVCAMVLITAASWPGALAARSGYIETPDGVPLYYETQGTGKAIVLIHGWTLNGEFWWRKNVPQLARMHQVVVLDLRGHGLSGKTSEGHSIDQYAKDVRLVLEKLDLRDATLVGWSMGTAVILGYVDQFGTDRLRSVVFVDQSPFFMSVPGWDHPLMGGFGPPGVTGIMAGLRANRPATVKGFLQVMFAEPVTAAVVDEMYAESMKTPTESAIAVFQDMAYRDFRPTLSKVTVPALLMYGRLNNKIFPTEVGAWLEANMPKAKLIRFEKSGHCPFWEEPEKFNAELAAFAQ